MNITELEKEIIKALNINSKIYWDTDPELNPNKEFKYLIKCEPIKPEPPKIIISFIMQ